MLTSLHIQNFKAWKDTGSFRLAPLTVIFGANSAGKSSLGHLLLALKQTALSTDRRRALNLGDSNSLIDLGTFRDCLYGHDLANPLTFKLGWRLPVQLEIRDPLEPIPGTAAPSEECYQGDAMALEVTIAAGKGEQPEVTGIRYALLADGEEKLDVLLKKNSSGKFELSSDRYRLVRKNFTGFPMPVWPASRMPVSSRILLWLPRACSVSFTTSGRCGIIPSAFINGLAIPPRMSGTRASMPLRPCLPPSHNNANSIVARESVISSLRNSLPTGSRTSASSTAFLFPLWQRAGRNTRS